MPGARTEGRTRPPVVRSPSVQPFSPPGGAEGGPCSGGRLPAGRMSCGTRAVLDPPDGLVAAMLWDCAEGAPPELLAALPPHCWRCRRRRAGERQQTQRAPAARQRRGADFPAECRGRGAGAAPAGTLRRTDPRERTSPYPEVVRREGGPRLPPRWRLPPGHETRFHRRRSRNRSAGVTPHLLPVCGRRIRPQSRARMRAPGRLSRCEDPSVAPRARQHTPEKKIMLIRSCAPRRIRRARPARSRTEAKHVACAKGPVGHRATRPCSAGRRSGSGTGAAPVPSDNAGRCSGRLAHGGPEAGRHPAEHQRGDRLVPAPMRTGCARRDHGWASGGNRPCR